MLDPARVRQLIDWYRKQAKALRTEMSPGSLPGYLRQKLRETLAEELVAELVDEGGAQTGSVGLRDSDLITKARAHVKSTKME